MADPNHHQPLVPPPPGSIWFSGQFQHHGSSPSPPPPNPNQQWAPPPPPTHPPYPAPLPYSGHATEEVILQNHERRLRSLNEKMDKIQQLMDQKFEQTTSQIGKIGDQITRFNQNLQTIGEEIIQKITRAMEAYHRSEKEKAVAGTQVPTLTIVSVTSRPQPSPKLDSLESLSAFTRQSIGGQVPPTQSVSAQSNTSLGSSGVSLDAGNSTSSQPQSLWPKMTCLEDWASLEKDHSVSLLGAIEALKVGTLRLPVIGAITNIQSMKEAISSALNVMQAVGSSICSLLSTAEEVNSWVAELAKVTEKACANGTQPLKFLYRLVFDPGGIMILGNLTEINLEDKVPSRNGECNKSHANATCQNISGSMCCQNNSHVSTCHWVCLLSSPN